MEFIKVTKDYDQYIALIQLNRPKELNALNLELMGEIRDTLRMHFEHNGDHEHSISLL